MLSILNFGHASQSTVSNPNPNPKPATCVENPGCTPCGPGLIAGGSCNGVGAVGYCNDNYTTMDSGNNIAVHTLPFTLIQSDTTSETCATITCNGGTTTCRANKLPVSTDAILAVWGPDHTKLPATSVTCKYYNPTCATCYTGWDCLSCSCTEPPPVSPDCAAVPSGRCPSVSCPTGCSLVYEDLNLAMFGACHCE